MIPKKSPPKSCDDLRPILLTPCMAKVTETFVARLLMSDIEPNIDPFQYGCLSGSNTSVYLVRLYDDILSWLEKGKSFVDLALADYRKAFDLIKHIIALNNLSEMGAKSDLLRLVADFLSQREQCVFALSEDDSNSAFLPITCGAPQGTKLAGIIFLAVINFILRTFKDRYKFVDDLSFLLKYLLEGQSAILLFDPSLPTVYQNECERASLTLNEQKCKVLRFNPLKSDFQEPPTLFKTVGSEKILGVIFSVDCKFNNHVSDLVRKGYAALQSLITMKRFGFSVNSMKLAFKTYILPIIEYACPVWGPSVQLSAGMCQDIEAIQIRACKIMLGQAFTTYDNALKVLGLESLFNRRQRLICQFGHFLLRSSKHRTILPPLAPVTSRTRRQYKLNPVTCRTTRYQHSFVPFFTDMVNKS